MPAPRSEFADQLAERLAPFGGVRAKRMFGGWGIFLDGLMFALIADEQLYLKSDAGNRERFAADNLPAFSYPRGGKMIELSYRLAPEEALEDDAVLLDWARSAIEAALRSRN
jgi:DNA transformation protein